GRGIDVGEMDVFGNQALLLRELAGLQDGAEADTEAAGPVADLDLLLRARASGAESDSEYGHAGNQFCDHAFISCVGSASRGGRNLAVSITGTAVPGHGRSSEIA